MDLSPEELRKIAPVVEGKLLRAGWIKAGRRTSESFDVLWTSKGKMQIERIYGGHLALMDFVEMPLSPAELGMLRTLSIMQFEDGKEL